MLNYATIKKKAKRFGNIGKGYKQQSIVGKGYKLNGKNVQVTVIGKA